MNSEIKTQWLEALRSGEYPQTKSALQRTQSEQGGPPVGFCCLGVLCDLAEKAGVVARARAGEGVVHYLCDTNDIEYLTESGVLPPQVREWAGLDEANPRIGDKMGAATLAEYNDTGRTFAKIADLIEEYL